MGVSRCILASSSKRCQSQFQHGGDLLRKQQPEFVISRQKRRLCPVPRPKRSQLWDGENRRTESADPGALRAIRVLGRTPWSCASSRTPAPKTAVAAPVEPPKMTSNRSFRDLESQLQQLTVNLWERPQSAFASVKRRISSRVIGNPRSPSSPMRFPMPVPAESGPVPAYHGARIDDACGVGCILPEHAPNSLFEILSLRHKWQCSNGNGHARQLNSSDRLFWALLRRFRLG
jgi:hypothetical protein